MAVNDPISTWRTIGKYRLGADVRVKVQVGDRQDGHNDDKPENLQETVTTLAKLARLLRRLTRVA